MGWRSRTSISGGQSPRIVFSSELFTLRDRLIGRTGADCLIVRIEPDALPEEQQVVQCLISAELPDGQLTVQGLAQGLDNVFAGRPERYPVVDQEQMRAARADLVLLPSEPFAFTSTRRP